MQPFSIPVLPSSAAPRTRSRTALLASSDRSLRQRLNQTLTGLRWTVREAETGAQAWTEAELSYPEAVIVDSWLPDLDIAEFLKDFRESFPKVDLLTTEGTAIQDGARSPYRQELLYALRASDNSDVSHLSSLALSKNLSTAPARNLETETNATGGDSFPDRYALVPLPKKIDQSLTNPRRPDEAAAKFTAHIERSLPASQGHVLIERLPEFIGETAEMLEISRRIRLVAPRSTPVLIEGPTGSGKELVADALHRLSKRSRKPFVAINCAAIPEALLEAELFGHTRGAFTGAIQSRVGRIESADGGTLFLDEIGEMPLSLQSKLLRFVETGELQRIGDNETVRVDVRIVAATHRPLAKHTQEGTFRADLYYRLAVFLIRTPALNQHAEDLPLLVNHFLGRMGRGEPIKHLDAGAMAQLVCHDWPGNVRELEHVLERASILAGDTMTITANDIDFGLPRN